jgi:hypothetical protein
LRAPRAHYKRQSLVALIFLQLGRGPAFPFRGVADGAPTPSPHLGTCDGKVSRGGLPVWLNHLSTAATQASNVQARKILRGEMRHEKDFCCCGDNPSVCPVRRARSRAHWRRSVRCVVGSSRFGTYWRGGRCCGRLHGGSLYCSLMGTEEIIRDPSRGTICKLVRERCLQ